jgi:hypothetical protein
MTSTGMWHHGGNISSCLPALSKFRPPMAKSVPSGPGKSFWSRIWLGRDTNPDRQTVMRVNRSLYHWHSAVLLAILDHINHDHCLVGSAACWREAPCLRALVGRWAHAPDTGRGPEPSGGQVASYLRPISGSRLASRGRFDSFQRTTAGHARHTSKRPTPRGSRPPCSVAKRTQAVFLLVSMKTAFSTMPQTAAAAIAGSWNPKIGIMPFGKA